ncbi:phosphate ABC transporter membrane protein 2, PhoT family [Desulfonispora thiosulfatigenes DSM 11270]|uniref:Phosphate transport system permease protein PstA n=1 Tax=Desulfonispora thiosulfatigenes DSM 11270 TaxID=656914 RepID=A0A1W1VFR9_DESTI|nr:phosphate ABC transporter permease PstA [Desulfonispora thiosulfatigenes]SMB92202.1 phosphate ABC transporter membrane protein 2, PhoT family [Desulfonispora thiosulfatigenes DSM 11270]
MMLTVPRGKEKIASLLLTLAAFSTVLILMIIIGYVIFRGINHISLDFLLDRPRKMGSEGGIFPVIVGTLYYAILTISIATPIGVGAAIYLQEYTRGNTLTKIIRFGTEILAGIPSIIFGLFGYAFFVVLLEEYTKGWSLVSGSLTATCMILPTIIRTSEEALKTVPSSFREASLSLGANRWQTIYKVVLPTAIPGILTGIILGIGRAIGETAALLLTLGGTLLSPESAFDGARTLSMHLYMVALETGNMDVAFATAVVLIILIFIINFIANFVINKIVAHQRR